MYQAVKGRVVYKCGDSKWGYFIPEKVPNALNLIIARKMIDDDPELKAKAMERLDR